MREIKGGLIAPARGNDGLGPAHLFSKLIIFFEPPRRPTSGRCPHQVFKFWDRFHSDDNFGVTRPASIHFCN